MSTNVTFAGSGTSATPNKKDAATSSDPKITHGVKKEKPAITTTGKTLEKFLEWAEYLYDYDRNKVRKILKAYDLSTYTPESWWTYAALVREHWMDEHAKKAIPEVCPICQAKTEQNSSDDGMYGARRGWRCTADHLHFAMSRWAHLKPVMVNRPDPLEVWYPERKDEKCLTLE